MSEKPPRVEVPAVADEPSQPPEAKLPESQPPEAKPTEPKPATSEKPPAVKFASERPKAEPKAKAAAAVSPAAKDATPSNAPSQTRSAILPLGIATAVIAGLLLWLGSGNDEPLPMEPETAAQAPVATPDVPAVHAVNEPKPEEPPAAATATAAPGAPAEATAEPAATASVDAAAAPSAEPALTASAAVSAEAAPSAAPAAAPEPPTASAEAASTPAPVESSEPVPSDEGLLEGPVTQVFMAPDCAELYRKGKRVGRSGVRVRVPEGKKRVFEVVCPGHNTRKLTLDGSRSEVNIGLRPIKR